MLLIRNLAAGEIRLLIPARVLQVFIAQYGRRADCQVDQYAVVIKLKNQYDKCKLSGFCSLKSMKNIRNGGPAYEQINRIS
jgi:hypothetical protein